MDTIAFLCPRRFKHLIVEFDFRMYAQNTDGKCTLNQRRLDVRVGTRNAGGLFFSTLSAFDGARPAHEQRCLVAGSTDISVPISAMIRIAEKEEYLERS